MPGRSEHGTAPRRTLALPGPPADGQSAHSPQADSQSAGPRADVAVAVPLQAAQRRIDFVQASFTKEPQHSRILTLRCGHRERLGSRPVECRGRVPERLSARARGRLADPGDQLVNGRRRRARGRRAADENQRGQHDPREASTHFLVPQRGLHHVDVLQSQTALVRPPARRPLARVKAVTATPGPPRASAQAAPRGWPGRASARAPARRDGRWPPSGRCRPAPSVSPPARSPACRACACGPDDPLVNQLGPHPRGALVDGARDRVAPDLDPEACRAVERPDDLLARLEVPAKRKAVRHAVIRQPHRVAADKTATTALAPHRHRPLLPASHPMRSVPEPPPRRPNAKPGGRSPRVCAAWAKPSALPSAMPRAPWGVEPWATPERPDPSTRRARAPGVQRQDAPRGCTRTNPRRPRTWLDPTVAAPGPCRAPGRGDPGRNSPPVRGVVRPSARRPSSRAACTTQFRIALAEGSNLRASSSGLWPLRTSSTSRWRNSAEYGRRVLGIGTPLPPSEDRCPRNRGKSIPATARPLRLVAGQPGRLAAHEPLHPSGSVDLARSAL